jgi:hypothetical protein
MWDPQRLTTLWAFTACYTDSFTFFLLTATETFETLESAYGEECLSRTSVFEWHKRFKEGRQSLQDDERKGRPSTSRTEESAEVIQKCWGKIELLSVRMLEEMTGISGGTVLSRSSR